MRRITKIGIIAGITGISAMAVRSVSARAFDKGFKTAMNIAAQLVEESFDLVKKDVDALEKRYHGLLDKYNELANDYCDLLDEVECPLDEESEETKEE